MKINPKAKNLRSVWKWGRHYSEQVDASVEEADVERLKRLRDELWEFMFVVRSRRLVDKRLSSSTREKLQKLYDGLRQREQILAGRISELQRNQEIIKRLETIALPEPAEKIETRDFSTWAMWPLRYSKRLRAKLAGAGLPG